MKWRVMLITLPLTMTLMYARLGNEKHKANMNGRRKIERPQEHSDRTW